MWIPLATFIFVLAVVLGAYWLGLLRPERHDRTQIGRRLRKLRPARHARAGLARSTAPLTRLPNLDRLLRRTRRVSVPLDRLIRESGAAITPSELLLASAAAALAAGVLASLITGQPLVALLAGGFAAFAPILWLQIVRQRRLRKFEELFPEAIDLISRALLAGHGFTAGVKMVGEELPAPVGTEFQLLYERQNYGEPLGNALKGFAARVPLIDARFFVTSVLTQRESGGNLSEVLQNLAGVIRERFRVKRQIRVITAHGRITGWVLAGLPPCVGLALYSLNPSDYRPLFTDPLGIRMVIGAIVLQIIGTLVIRKLINVEY
jgi:tight adherence protein B